MHSTTLIRPLFTNFLFDHFLERKCSQAVADNEASRGSANDAFAWRWCSMKNEVLSPNEGKSKDLLPPKYFFIEALMFENQSLYLNMVQEMIFRT